MAKIWGGRWQNVRELQPGGQAQTFIVADINEHSVERVLKRLKNTSPTRRERFRQEAEAIQAHRHPNLIELVDYSLDTNEPYIVTEYCPGGSLQDVEISTVPDDLLREWFLDVCFGLSAVHEAGQVHRDVKPANIFLRSPNGPAVLGDFGLVYVDGQDRLTMTQEQVGSRYFMAPELRDGKSDKITPSADVYSLGKTLYWMLSGGRLFDRENHRDADNKLSKIRANHYFEHVHLLLDSMITLEPSDRYKNAAAVIGAAQKVWELMDGHYNAVNTPEQPCRYCGRGMYQAMTWDDYWSLGLGKGQINKDSFRVLCCSFCGHVLYFWAAGSKAGDWIRRSGVPTRR